MAKVQFSRAQTRLFCLSMLIAGLGLIPLRLWVAVHQSPRPEAILVLEGQVSRIYFAADFARQHAGLPVWVSGNPEGQDRNQAIFHRAGVAASRVTYDSCAVDTVTNFTCTVNALAASHVDHVYVITSDYHRVRSQAIAAIVFGSRGIAATPISVPSVNRVPESPWRTWRDCIRSLLWLVSGYTGAVLHHLR